MAIVCAELVGARSATNTDATSYATSSVTLTAGRLYVIMVASRFSATPNTPTVTSTGATWVAIDNQTYTTTPTHKISALRTMVASDQTGAITMDFAGQTQVAAGWFTFECTGVDTSGTNGSGAIVTSNKNSQAGGTTLPLTFAAYSDSANRPICGFASNAGSDGTVDWTLLQDSFASDGLAISGSWLDATSDTTNNYVYGSNVSSGGIGVEIKAAAATGDAAGAMLRGMI